MPDVHMPRLSDSMEEGTILRWLKADGDQVARGEELVEIETDKAAMTYEADASGPLRILAAAGETVALGAVIAAIGDGSQAAPPAPAPAPAAAPPAEAPPADHAAPVVTTAPARARRVQASPVARRVAAELGVALDSLRGSGPDGRVVKADVLAAARDATPAAGSDGGAAAVAAAPAQGARGAVEVEQLSRMQQTIARRMAESKATVPDFAIEVDVDMGAALDLREQIKQTVERPPSVNDLVVKAAAHALRRHPRVNGSYRDGRFERYERVNVGVAVATDDGLVVPTVFDADRHSLGAVAAETRRLAERVRTGEVTPPELAGATFTVSNLGMLGVDRFAGVVDQPQAAILCVGRIARRPAVDERDELVVRPQMTLTLVSDHRILYGADAARFLADVREALEHPLTILVG